MPPCTDCHSKHQSYVILNYDIYLLVDLEIPFGLKAYNTSECTFFKTMSCFCYFCVVITKRKTAATGLQPSFCFSVVIIATWAGLFCLALVSATHNVFKTFVKLQEYRLNIHLISRLCFLAFILKNWEKSHESVYQWIFKVRWQWWPCIMAFNTPSFPGRAATAELVKIS